MRTDKQQTEYILRLRDEALARRKNTKRLLIQTASIAACLVFLCTAVMVSIPLFLSAKDSGNACGPSGEDHLSYGAEKYSGNKKAEYYPLYNAGKGYPESTTVPPTDKDGITYFTYENLLYLTAIEYNGAEYLPAKEITEDDTVSSFIGKTSVGILLSDGEKTEKCKMFKVNGEMRSEAVAVKIGKIYILYCRNDAIK